MSLLNHLSWASYFETVILLLVIYYLFVGFRFYKTEIQRLLGNTVKNNSYQNVPGQLQYKEAGKVVNESAVLETYPNESYPDEDIHLADNLTAAVKRCIAATAGKAHAPDQLIPQIKDIFNKHASLKHSPHRPAINELVVSECVRTGVAELTEDEVDAWWSS
jgi:hypothetical protein